MNIEIEIFAPVLIPTLCRYEHFKRCVESLSCCNHSEKTDLIIALDYPLLSEHWDGYRKIKEYLPFINGFKSLVVVERSQNFGVAKNINQARENIFRRYDRLIFSEDDNEFSPNFLDYINKGLKAFKDDPRIYAVCGYAYMQEKKFEFAGGYGISHRFSASGYGVTRDRYQQYYALFIDLDSLKKILMSFRKSWRIFRFDPFRLSTLITQVDKKSRFPDFAICSHMIVHDMYNVFPNLSLVRNHGYDGSGANSYTEKTNELMCFSTQQIDVRKEFFFGDLPAQDTIESYESHVLKLDKTSVVHIAWVAFRYMFYRITGKALYLSSNGYKSTRFLLRKPLKNLKK
ncbi:MAG: glycosyltransferase family A protein [Kiritimatiellae bacterium]|jgi:hypothetical protein|nr:glycosyltransferase family A protein [Kiritimatiellia bacterium]